MRRRSLLGLLAAACGGDDVTFSRRTGSRATGRGRGGGGGPSVTPKTMLGSALAVWLRGDLGATVSTSAFDALANQGDVSVAASITQGTSARRPLVSSTRGRQSLFHKSSLQHWMNVAAFSAAIPQPWTLVAVIRSQSLGTTTHLARASNTAYLQSLGAAWPRNILAFSGTASNITHTGGIAEDELVVYERLANGASGQLWKNGVSVGTGTGSNAWDGLWVGSSATPGAYIDGQTCEILLVNRALTAQERTDLMTYFQNAWRVLDEQLLWWPLGDSLTAGDNGNNWRELLTTSYSASGGQLGGIWPCATGSVKNFGWWDDKMNGVSGATLAAIATTIGTHTGIGNLYNAPVVATLMGTNDCRNNGAVYVGGTGVGTTIQAYADNLTAIDANIFAATGIRPQILVTTLPDCNPSQATAQANINEFNGNLPAAWTTLEGAGLNLRRWDVRAALGDWSATYYGADNFHPNAAGAVVIKTAIQAPLALAFAAA